MVFMYVLHVLEYRLQMNLLFNSQDDLQTLGAVMPTPIWHSSFLVVCLEHSDLYTLYCTIRIAKCLWEKKKSQLLYSWESEECVES
jgi:hypothetical protein